MEVRQQVAKEQAMAPKRLAGLAALQVQVHDSFLEAMRGLSEPGRLGESGLVKCNGVDLGFKGFLFVFFMGFYGFLMGFHAFPWISDGFRLERGRRLGSRDLKDLTRHLPRSISIDQAPPPFDGLERGALKRGRRSPKAIETSAVRWIFSSSGRPCGASCSCPAWRSRRSAP